MFFFVPRYSDDLNLRHVMLAGILFLCLLWGLPRFNLVCSFNQSILVQDHHPNLKKNQLFACNLTHRIHVWYIGIYTNIGGVLMVNVTIYGIHGSYG